MDVREPELRRLLQRDIERVVLDNGVKVWTEHVPRATSVALGVWINAGSRYEDVNESGSTHLIQRTAFHGTSKRSAKKIALAVKRFGGDVSITTGRDYAGYLARVAPDDANKALDLLADLALRPALGRQSIAAEQSQILQELREAEADPDVTLESMFLRSIWMDRGLSRPPRGRLLGFRGDTKVYDFKPRSLQRLHRESHHPGAITVTLSGRLRHDGIQKMARKLFGPVLKPEKTASTLATACHRFVALRNRTEFPGVRMMLGFPACSASDLARHTAGLMGAILGGGPNSRLARHATDKTLRVQNAVSEIQMFADTGVLALRLKSKSNQAERALDTMVAELRSLTMKPVGEAELTNARQFRSVEMMKSIGSTTDRIRDLARQERYFGGLVDFGDECEKLNSVTAEEVQRQSAGWIAPHTLSLAALGDLDGVRLAPESLRW